MTLRSSPDFKTSRGPIFNRELHDINYIFSLADSDSIAHAVHMSAEPLSLRLVPPPWHVSRLADDSPVETGRIITGNYTPEMLGLLLEPLCAALLGFLHWPLVIGSFGRVRDPRIAGSAWHGNGGLELIGSIRDGADSCIGPI